MCFLCAPQTTCPIDGDPDNGILPDLSTSGSVMLDWLDSHGLEVADADALFGNGDVTLTTPGDSNVTYPEQDPTAFGPFYDIPSGTGTWVELLPGFRMNAEISFSGDTDWFGMVLTQGQTYQISLKALTAFGFGLGDPSLFLFDNTGALLISDDNSGSGNNSLLTVTATRSGVYFVGATGFGGGNSTVGQYQISLSQVNFASDTVGDRKATAGTVAVNTQSNGTIDFIGDEDWYAITVEKGKTYAVFLEGAPQSFNPLIDPNLEILDQQLNVVASNNDNGVSSNSLATFEAVRDGTYYIKATGSAESTGDFRLTAAEFIPPEQPDPLVGVDWGVKFDKTNIKVYFAKAGETFWDSTMDSDWTAYEKQQANAALGEYSKISMLTFQTVNNAANADFVLTKGFLDSGLSGKMVPQDPEFGDDQGVGWFNTNPNFWSDGTIGLLEAGAYGYSNFIHEFGHGLGLAHPHDDANGLSVRFDGVLDSGDLGTFGLNQEVFTIMSYNKGWSTGPNGGSGTNNFGIAMTPMGFDIAVIQQKYGANMSYKTGDDVYTLVSTNGRGTGYMAIWDAGGSDTIRHAGNAASTIDLRPATLKLEEGGGGFVSFVDGIFGGFTIANGVVIEKAVGGRGIDTITGNSAKNELIGQAGNDLMAGGRGNDTLNGGQGRDSLDGGDGADLLIGGKSADTLAGGRGNDVFVYNNLNEGGDSITDFSSSGTGNDDRFEFLGAAFGDLPEGVLGLSRFQSSASAVAQSAGIRFFLETDTGILRFDRDGNKDGFDAIVVATLLGNASLSAGDIFLI